MIGRDTPTPCGRGVLTRSAPSVGARIDVEVGGGDVEVGGGEVGGGEVGRVEVGGTLGRRGGSSSGEALRDPSSATPWAPGPKRAPVRRKGWLVCPALWGLGLGVRREGGADGCDPEGPAGGALPEARDGGGANFGPKASKREGSLGWAAGGREGMGGRSVFEVDPFVAATFDASQEWKRTRGSRPTLRGSWRRGGMGSGSMSA